MVFLTELASNASAHNISVVIYSGNNDFIAAHTGSESMLTTHSRGAAISYGRLLVAIQNTTFGGTQGFSKQPSTAWYDDSGLFAGIIHQERNWTYALFEGAGHLVPMDKPEAVYFLCLHSTNSSL